MSTLVLVVMVILIFVSIPEGLVRIRHHLSARELGVSVPQTPKNVSACRCVDAFYPSRPLSSHERAFSPSRFLRQAAEPFLGTDKMTALDS